MAKENDASTGMHAWPRELSHNNFAYAVWIHAKLLVVCTNRWDVEVKAVPHADREWLAANSAVVRVDEPLFVA